MDNLHPEVMCLWYVIPLLLNSYYLAALLTTLFNTLLPCVFIDIAFYRVSLAMDTEQRDDAAHELKAYLQSATSADSFTGRPLLRILSQEQLSQAHLTRDQYAAAAKLYAIEVVSWQIACC